MPRGHGKVSTDLETATATKLLQVSYAGGSASKEGAAVLKAMRSSVQCGQGRVPLKFTGFTRMCFGASIENG